MHQINCLKKKTLTNYACTFKWPCHWMTWIIHCNENIWEVGRNKKVMGYKIDVAEVMYEQKSSTF